MFIVVDLIILAVLILCVGLGYKRGLAGCLIRVLAFFIAVAVSAVLFKPAAALVTSSTQIDENIQSSIVSVFEKEDLNESDSSKSDSGENKDLSEQNDVNKQKQDSPIMKYISDKVEDATEEKKMEIVNDVAKEISLKIIDVLCFIGIFIIIRIVLTFIKELANIITKLPIIKQCDKIGGVLYGVLQASVIIFIALALITFVSTITNQYTVLELINQSYIGSVLNSNNILLNIIF